MIFSVLSQFVLGYCGQNSSYLEFLKFYYDVIYPGLECLGTLDFRKNCGISHQMISNFGISQPFKVMNDLDFFEIFSYSVSIALSVSNTVYLSFLSLLSSGLSYKVTTTFFLCCGNICMKIFS